jgi:hypothetical protein
MTIPKSHCGTIPELKSYVLNMRLGLALPLHLVLAFFATLQSHASDLALVGAKIYLSPSERTQQLPEV